LVDASLIKPGGEKIMAIDDVTGASPSEIFPSSSDYGEGLLPTGVPHFS
jgi:hypothetical protein